MTTPDLRALSFTVKQAFLSALLSVVLAIPLARALARRRFFGRDLLTSLLGAPFLLPVIVAILGVIAVWGRSGWIADGMGWAGLGRLNVYGMPGVLIAHVFFNLPLAARLILQGFSDLPPERWRVAAQLGIEGRALFRLGRVARNSRERTGSFRAGVSCLRDELCGGVGAGRRAEGDNAGTRDL